MENMNNLTAARKCLHHKKTVSKNTQDRLNAYDMDALIK